MNRKTFLKKGILSGTSLAIAPTMLASEPAGDVQNDDTSFNLHYAPHFGMFQHLAGSDMIDQLNFMADQGFTAFEDNGMMNRDESTQKKIGEQLAKLDMQMGVFVIDKGGNGANSFTEGKQKHTDIFIDACKEAVGVAKRVNATWMTVVPGNFDRSLPLDIQTSNVVETLRRGAEIFESHDLVMVLEPLSDTPDLFLRTSAQAYNICRAVDSPSCKILYDIYHLQKNEGNIINNIDLTWDEIAYFQQGDNPGRNEPGTGEINYNNVFEHIHERGFTGILGMEHGNSQSGAAGERALIEAYKQADDFS